MTALLVTIIFRDFVRLNLFPNDIIIVTLFYLLRKSINKIRLDATELLPVKAFWTVHGLRGTWFIVL